MADNLTLFSPSEEGELYHALTKKDKSQVIKKCREFPEGPFRVVTKRRDCVLQLALFSKQVDLVLDLLSDELLTPLITQKLNHENSSGNTILHEAATQDNCIEAAIRIMELEPQLLTQRNKKGEWPIFRAARYGQMKMFKFLDDQIEIQQVFQDEEQQLKCYKVEKQTENDPRRPYTVLHVAIYHQHFEMASYIAQKYPSLINEENQFGMTGLHILAMNPSAFKYSNKAWLEYLMPSPPSVISEKKGVISEKKGVISEKKVGGRFIIPWWHEIRKECLRYEAAVNLAKILIEADTSWMYEEEKQSETSRPRKPPSPLVLATKWGCVEIVLEILTLHPQTVEQVDPEYGSILHTAIRYRRIKILRRFEKMEMAMRKLVRKTDKNGNSILHMVGENIRRNQDTKAATNTLPWDLQKVQIDTRSPAFELRDDLLLFDDVERILKTHHHKDVNSKGESPEDVFATNKEGLRGKAEEWLKRTAENCSIVAVLIATVAFAAAYTVPGGLNQETGSPILISQSFFVVFTICDVLSLTFALTSVVIFLSILTSSFRLHNFKEALPQKIMIGLSCLIFSVTMMMLAFGASIVLMIKNKQQWTKIALYAVAFLPVTVLAASYLPLYLPLMGTFHYSVRKITSFFPHYIPESPDICRSSRHQVTTTQDSSNPTQSKGFPPV